MIRSWVTNKHCLSLASGPRSRLVKKKKNAGRRAKRRHIGKQKAFLPHSVIFQGRLLTSAGVAHLLSGQTQSHPCFPLLPTHQHLLRTSPSLLSRVQIILPTSPWLCVASCARVKHASIALTAAEFKQKPYREQGVNSTVIQRVGEHRLDYRWLIFPLIQD